MWIANAASNNFKVCLSQNLKYTLFQVHLTLNCVIISLDTSILSKLDSNLYSGKGSWPLSTVYSIFEVLENNFKKWIFFSMYVHSWTIKSSYFLLGTLILNPELL